MRYNSLIAVSLALASKALASPIYVTEYDYLYETVVVDAYGNPVTTELAGQSLEPPAPVTVSHYYSTSLAVVNNNVANSVGFSTSSPAAVVTSAAAAPTTSTTSTSATTPASTSVVIVPSVETSSPIVVSSASSAPAPVTSSSTPPTTIVVQQSTSSASPSSTSVFTSTSASVETAAAATTSTSATSSASDSEVTDVAGNSLEAQFLAVHNKDRALHKVGNLAWNSTLAAYATKYLEGSNCKFAHSGGPYGENIALGYSTATKAADAWYNEESLYDYSAGQFSEATGHFTQMVWKATTQLGCASIQCSSGTFYACEYYPRGNIIGQFTENVFE